MSRSECNTPFLGINSDEKPPCRKHFNSGAFLFDPPLWRFAAQESAMKFRNRFSLSVFIACASMAFAAVPAHAIPVVVKVGADYAAMPYAFTIDGSTFTFSGTGDPFNPTAVQTAGRAQVNTIFGSPTSYFVNRSTVMFGPGMQFAAFPATTTVPYSNSDNFIGLLATLGGRNFYGYAFTTDTVLNSYAFETAPDTAITATAAVPEPASWLMLIGGVGVIGGLLRHRRTPVALA